MHESDEKEYTPIKGEVRLRDVSRRLHPLFLQGSRSKEAKAVRASFTPLTRDEEQRVMQEEPERILDSRWIDAWKSQDDPQVYPPECRIVSPCYLSPKSRWVIRGYSDPDVAHMTVDSPAPDRAEVQMTLQLMVSHKVEIWVADVKAAFNQSLEHQRAVPIYAWVPEGGIEGVDKSVKVLRLEREVYGTLAGPALWRRTVLTAAKKEGLKGHPLSGCLLCYFEGQQAVGWILVLVDDLLVGWHGKAWEGMLQSLKSSFEIGKWTSLKQTEPQSYGGRSMRQLPDWSVMSDMSDYVSKIGAIQIEKQRGKQRTAVATDAEVKEFRRVIGSFLWAARGGVVQVHGDVTILASRTTKLVVDDLFVANKVLKKAQLLVRPILTLPIPPKDMHWIGWSDASLANREDQRTQLAHVVGVAEMVALEGKPAKFSFLLAHSHKMQRAASSTSATEACAL
eukprot:6468495-Amphidinium_carterae.1